jgi:hypothetical protein
VRLAVLLMLLVSGPAWGQDRSTFEGYRKDVEAKKCEKSEEPAVTIFQCDKEMTFYYFTKPLHPAHPSVIERALKENAQGVYFAENGRSFAPEKAQGAFDAWLKEFKQLDEQVRQDIAREQAQPPANKQPANKAPAKP